MNSNKKFFIYKFLLIGIPWILIKPTQENKSYDITKGISAAPQWIINVGNYGGHYENY